MSRRMVAASLSAVLCLCALDAFAIMPFPNWKIYAYHGSPHAMAGNGRYLWVGGEGCLVKYDKMTKEKIQFTYEEGYPIGYVTCMLEDAQGNVWVANEVNSRHFYGDGIRPIPQLVKITPASWVNYATLPIASNSSIVDMVEDKNHDLWFCDGGIVRLHGDVWERTISTAFLAGLPDVDSARKANGWAYVARKIAYDVSRNELLVRLGMGMPDEPDFVYAPSIYRYNGATLTKLPEYAYSGPIQEKWIQTSLDHPFYQLTTSRNGQVWLGSQFGLFRFDGTSYTMGADPSIGFRDVPVCQVFMDRKENLWVGSDLLYRFDGANWTYYDSIIAPPPDWPGLEGDRPAMIDDSMGNVWAIGKNSLHRFNGSTWVVEDSSVMLSTTAPSGLSKDRNGSIWIWGSDIRKFNGASFDYISSSGGGPTFFHDSTGSTWFWSSYGGLSKYDGVQTTFFDLRSPVRGMGYDKSGRLLIGVDENPGLIGKHGLLMYSNGEFIPFPDQIPADIQIVNIIFTDAARNLWCHYMDYWGRGGLARYDGTQWTIFDSLHSSGYSLMIQDTSGRIWAKGDSGIEIFDGTAWDTLPAADSILNSVQVMYRDRAGALWLGGRITGLVRYDGREFVKFNPVTGRQLAMSDPGPFPDCYSICEDRDGNLWLGSNVGLIRFDGHTSKVYTASNSGLPSNACYDVVEDDSGRLWIDCAYYLAVFDKGKELPVAQTPRLHPAASRLSVSQINGRVIIQFTVSSTEPARLSILSPDGRTVRTLPGGERTPGTRSVTWDRGAEGGSFVPAGMYLVCLRTGKSTEAKMITLAR